VGTQTDQDRITVYENFTTRTICQATSVCRNRVRRAGQRNSEARFVSILKKDFGGVGSVLCGGRILTIQVSTLDAGREPIPRPASFPLSDGDLMAKVSGGSVESFVDLYDRYRDRAYRVARSVCHDDGRAQEAVQDGFLAVWNGRTNFRSQQGSVGAWLLTVVRYRAIDVARSNHRHASRRASDDQLPTHSAWEDPCETAVMREDAQRVQASLATLPDAQAEVITLAYYGQLTHTEIAAQLGLPRGTVKGRMRLGLQKLRADLEPIAI
jgi:RNA polymerase sigma-70 factor (ECF subfamily)